MQTVIQALREIIGTPDFYIDNGNYSSTWDYGAMLEYAIAGMLVLIVVGSVLLLPKNELFTSCVVEKWLWSGIRKTTT